MTEPRRKFPREEMNEALQNLSQGLSSAAKKLASSDDAESRILSAQVNATAKAAETISKAK